ncbi:Nuclear hormone receptor family member nhr-18 [Caenorhabditis elegans]|uniref:Nuclear hormone receptor family member nhr-18 n=1 Tax=Caenorhabditis elegans TaxID=6239 RepID=NHR18_CAEEL|nr:Nuclear hormone receptor family member nhr-18 [Caenorhabditis elegans]O16360.3 RecName: Full=Nuclear hormone receptor family member nhr-18 [Caenorhabditis elegans]CCD71003.1 Nuclear hormone receptor family member nhr-18 [Caenorhabditis elegans]|eukprot:NP_503608.2 Nuclear hormone receptor family member nhr-18 [Caenorhabditis elegans]
MPAPLFLSGSCEVCGDKTSGRHFGVMSCRACAAFFRRAATWNLEKRICPNGTCHTSVNGKFNCKQCRLKKCLDVGMDTRRFQTDRDLISCSAISQSLATFLGRPEFILCCEPDRASVLKTTIDVTRLVNIARDMLQKPTNHVLPSNSLEQLATTLDNMRCVESNKEVKFIEKYGKVETLKSWEQGFLRVVEWFSNFSEFRELNERLKLEIVKSCWFSWTRLDKLSETANKQINKMLGKSQLMVGNGACMNMNNFEIDLSWCTNYSLEQLKYFFQTPNGKKNFQQSIQDMIDLNPSSIEVSYMLLHLSLEHAGKRLHGDALDATENLVQVQANNLHKYYVEKLKLANYSSRLTQLMRITRTLEADIRIRIEKKQIADVFNIMKIDFSHPEMFEAT